jgi:hypothetical protein
VIFAQINLRHWHTPAQSISTAGRIKNQKREAFMKTVPFISFVILAALFSSCATVGQFKPVSEGERVIGTIQTTFIARDSWLKKNETINAQVYIKLLEAAAQKYPGEIDVRDILWATGSYLGGISVEVSATGKVVRREKSGG